MLVRCHRKADRSRKMNRPRIGLDAWEKAMTRAALLYQPPEEIDFELTQTKADRMAREQKEEDFRIMAALRHAAGLDRPTELQSGRLQKDKLPKRAPVSRRKLAV